MQTISLKKRGGVKGEMKATTGREGRKGGKEETLIRVYCGLLLFLESDEEEEEEEEGRKEGKE